MYIVYLIKIISRLRTGYTMAMHTYIIKKEDNNECPFSDVRLTVDHILWECKETEAEIQRANTKITSGRREKTE
jgi:hypothetical protein